MLFTEVKNMKIIKKIILLLVVLSLIPVKVTFAEEKIITVSGSGVISGDGVSFDSTDVILPKKSSMKYMVNTDETSLYRVMVKGLFNEESIYNISVDSIVCETVTVHKNSCDKLVFYINLKEGTRELKVFTVTGRALIMDIDICAVLETDATKFVERINNAKKVQDVKNVIDSYDDAIRLNKMMMSGGDIHTSSCSRIGKSGIAFPRRICTNEDLVNALRSCDLRLIINGEITK